MLKDAPYAYAKACGIIGKSFVGRRIASLAGLHSLIELDRLLFPGLHRELPGRELLADMEHRIIERAVNHILAILDSYTQPPELLVRMLKVFEYSDLKACFQNIAAGKKELPKVCSIGHFQTVNFDAFPDIKAMLRGSEYDFLLADKTLLQPGNIDIAKIETQLDVHYYNRLAECIPHLPSEERQTAQKILADEISLRNCVWALRLRTYYQKDPAQTRKYLMDIKLRGNSRKDSSLADEAFESLELPLDTRSSWRGWRWEKFLNPENAALGWTADPRFFQNAASHYLYRLAMKNFHRLPMEINTAFCFIKLKQFEEDLLTSVAEGLAMGMDSAAVFKLLEVPSC